MYADMVGYTALGQRNESLSLALVHEQRKLVRQTLKRHAGTEVKTIGDALLVEFENALDAVRCAYDIQRATREFNFSQPGDRRISLRIGVHLGDVEKKAGDIMGDTVNVASRIEHLADAGGICITRQVYDQVANKFELPMLSIGSKQLKNVAAPVEVYSIVLPWEENGHEQALDSLRVAVLPLANMSPDPEDAYFADGITEELISTLSKIKELSVISRTSVMQYKDKPRSIQEIGTELRAGTILEGSVRKASGKVRVTIQMVDSLSDKHQWAESYDRELNDIFEIQSDIANRVASALRIQLLMSERGDIQRKPTESIEAYQFYMKGRYCINQQTREDSERALQFFRRAIELDPRCSVAYAGISDCYHVGSHFNWYSPEDAFPRMKDSATRAIEIDPRLAEAHSSLGAVYFHYEWRWKEANEEFNLAIQLSPSYAQVYEMQSYLLAVIGDSEESAARAKRGSELSPEYVSTWLTAGLNWVGGAMLKGKDIREAINQLEGFVGTHGDFPSVHDSLGFAYFRSSRLVDALTEIQKAVSLSNGDPAFKCDLALMYALTGQEKQAKEILRELRETSKSRYVSPVQLACTEYRLGMKAEAFADLEIAFQRKAIDLPDLRLVPEASELRTDPRWVSIETRMGLGPS